MKFVFTKANELIKKKKIKKIGEGKMGALYQVDKDTVRIFTKPGRILISCTCFNGTKYINSPALCKHKVAAILEYAKENEE